MKKYIIPSIMLIIIVLLIILRFVVNKNEKKEEYSYNGTYEQLNINYLNNKLFSNHAEKITLDNGTLFYEKNVIYEDEAENIKISKKYNYEEIDDYIVVEGKKYQIKDEKICLNSSCTENYAKAVEEKTTYLDDVTFDDTLIAISSLENVKKEKELTFVVVVQTGCIHCEIFEQVLKSIIYDYDVKFQLLNIRKVSDELRNEIINDYMVEATPTILMFKDGQVIDRVDSSLSKQALAELLTEKGFKNR